MSDLVDIAARALHGQSQHQPGPFSRGLPYDFDDLPPGQVDWYRFRARTIVDALRSSDGDIDETVAQVVPRLYALWIYDRDELRVALPLIVEAARRAVTAVAAALDGTDL